MRETPAPVSPPASLPSPATLASALRALEPREAALLSRRLLAGRSLEDCAAFYGTTPGALSVLLLRAGLALACASGLPVRAPASEEEEASWARMLAEALEGGAAPVAGALVPTLEVCQRLRAWRAEVRTALEAAERLEADSPRRRHQEWARRLALAALVALAAWLYFSRPAPPPTPAVDSPAGRR